MDKKAMLLAEEVLKMILGLLAISLLAFLLFSLYNLNKMSKDLELAESSLNQLSEELNLNSTKAEIYNPEGWFLSSWPSVSGDIPNTCTVQGWKSCICLCDSKLLSFSEIKECNSGGICLNNSQDYFIQGFIEIKNPPLELDINSELKTISKS